MFIAFKKYIEDNSLLKPDDRILLAVSGGIDSMVMTHLFLQTELKLGILHCNFSLRDLESDKDEEMVRQFAENNSIPFFSKKFDTKEFAGRNGVSVQMAARELRYKWFEEIRNEQNYDLIAVAHNLNDNIETLIINLSRGTGIAGLSGMKPLINNIIRPLLFATRNDIVAYSEANGIVYREDQSNADTKYTRNKIRHQLIPVLKEINPSIEQTLNETAERFTEINEIVTEYICRIRGKITEHKDGNISFSVGSLKELLHNKTILFELFKPYGITGVQLDDLIKVINGNTGGQIFTSNGRIIKNRKEIIISPEIIRTEPIYDIGEIADFKNVPAILSAEIKDVTENFQISYDSTVGCLDLDKLIFPLKIRKWKTGDYFYPLGMKQKKKLSDYFIDNKFSLIDKENILILESGGEIIWIIGDRIDNRFRISKTTKRALILRSAKKQFVIKKLN